MIFASEIGFKNFNQIDAKNVEEFSYSLFHHRNNVFNRYVYER